MSLSNLLHLSYESQYGIREVIEMFAAKATPSIGEKHLFDYTLDSIMFFMMMFLLILALR